MSPGWIRKVWMGLAIAASTLVLAGCLGWAHPMHWDGPRHGRWEDDWRTGRQGYGPQAECAEGAPANAPGRPPCPYPR